MTLLYFDEAFLEHKTPPGHPERVERAERIWGRLKSSGLVERATKGTCRPIDADVLKSVHSPAMLERVLRACASSSSLDVDTPTCAQSARVAQRAAGTAVGAVDDVLTMSHQNAFCVIRPPGHHATPKKSMGFCLYNNVALAARRALDHHRMDRILIVDWDVHHGNGTQDAFYADGRVTFFSAHRYPFYPGTGASDETGTGKGLGAIFNLPLAFGTPSKVYLKAFEQMLTRAAERSRPQLVFISAGFDAHQRDPIGNLGLDSGDYVQLTTLVVEMAKSHGAKIVSLLEGGYDLEALAESVEHHLATLIDSESASKSAH